MKELPGYWIEHVEAPLVACPKLIKVTSQRVADLRIRADKLEARLKRHRVDVLLTVAGETVTEGEGEKAKTKAKFTNDTAREAETDRRLAGDDAYKMASRERDDVQRELVPVVIELEYEQDRQRNARALARLLSNGGEDA